MIRHLLLFALFHNFVKKTEYTLLSNMSVVHLVESTRGLIQPAALNPYADLSSHVAAKHDSHVFVLKFGIASRIHVILPTHYSIPQRGGMLHIRGVYHLMQTHCEKIIANHGVTSPSRCDPLLCGQLFSLTPELAGLFASEQ